jgi:hypothetical protein
MIVGWRCCCRHKRAVMEEGQRESVGQAPTYVQNSHLDHLIQLS